MSKNNLNLPPNNKCKRCKNPVQNGLKCVACGTVSHKSCLNALKTVKFLSDSTVNCCSENYEDHAVTIPAIQASTSTNEYIIGTSHVDDIKIKYLEELVQQKDLTIANQTIAINSLLEQISYLKQQLIIHEGYVHRPQTPKVLKPSYANKAAAKHTDSQANVPTQIKSCAVTPAAVSHAIHIAESSKICQDIIQLNQDDPVSSPHGTNYNKRSHMTKRSRNILVGQAKNLPGNSLLKSAATFRHFHTTNWDPNTSEGVLLEYLKEFVPEVHIEKLASRQPSRYASFKVSVPFADVDKLTRPDIWPSGVSLNQFFRPKESSI